MSTDPLIAVEKALTDEARESWLRRAFEMYPRLRGAKVADVLEHLNGTDSHLRLVEPWWETHGQRLTLDLLCDAELLSASCRLAIVATGASVQVPFDILAEVVARAAAAGEQGVVNLDQVSAIPDDGLYHGSDLDAAANADEVGPEHMGVCLTALETRREAFLETQMKEARFATGLLVGDDPDDPFDGEGRAEWRAGLLELKRTIEESNGKPMTAEEASVLALRTIIGGSWSRGMEIGLNLARNRQAKQRTWEVEEYSNGTGVLLTGPSDAPAGEYVLVERGKL